MPSKMKFSKQSAIFPALSHPFSRQGKDIISIFICMILVILASQSNAFDFLIDTHLGRLGLIGAILTISYMNHIFGAAISLFLVMAFAVNYDRREGLENKEMKINHENNNDVHCGEYLLNCPDCKLKGNGSFCDKHALLCNEKNNKKSSIVQAVESMCGLQKKEKEGFEVFGDDVNSVILKERQLQLGDGSNISKVKSSSSSNVSPFDQSFSSHFGTEY
jgi:hypothetical protein